MFRIDNFIAFLTVRSKSSRLPEKCFLPFGSTNVLGHVISRAKYFGIDSVVCTSLDASDDKIEDYCRSNKVNFFRGSFENKLKRWLACARHLDVPYFHTIDVDDPFFDPLQIFESIFQLTHHDLDVVYPTKISSSGSASVGYSIRTSYLEKVVPNFESVAELEMVDTFFNKFNFSKNMALNSRYQEIESVRLTLDYPEDYALLSRILKTCGHYCTRIEIYNLFKSNPDLHRINWFRNTDWQNNQSTIRLGQSF